MEGYAKLGLLMGEFPEHAIFRRFAALNAQNLLYFQAELVHLERKLRECANEDELSDKQRRKDYSKDWWSLSGSESQSDDIGEDSEQWKTCLEIRDKLQKYNEALVLQKKITTMDRPHRKDLNFLQKWMTRVDMGNVYLIGRDSDIWSEPHISDLLALKNREIEDPFSRWVADTVVWWYYSIVGKEVPYDPERPHMANMIRVSDAKILRVTKLLIIVLASLLPIGSIVILYFMDTAPKRLGAIGGLTALFSFSLGLVTNARMIDIFSATAAFAAVQVVYVGTAQF